MTWLGLITLAYQDLNYYALGDAIPAEGLNLGLLVLNGFIDFLGTKRLSMWTINRQIFHLIGGQQNYKMGPNSTDPGWNVPRPTQIYRAGVILPGSPDYEKPIDIITDAQYAATRIKQLPSTFPTEVYDDGSWPDANIYYYPLPQNSYDVTLYVPLQVTQVTSDIINDDISLPPGYQFMLEYGLVKHLGPKCSVAPAQWMITLADSSLLSVMTNNQPELLLRTEKSMRANRRDDYNILTGGFGRRGDN